MFYLRILHVKHQGISVFAAREGHCKLSEVRRRSEVEKKGVELRSHFEKRVSRLPKPNAGKSSVGVVQAGLPQQELSAWSQHRCPALQASHRSDPKR